MRRWAAELEAQGLTRRAMEEQLGVSGETLYLWFGSRWRGTEAKRAEARRMHARGLSHGVIAYRFNVSRTTARRWTT